MMRETTIADIGDPRARQDDGELVAAEPAGDVAPAQRLAQRGADLAQRLVAGRVAEQLVDALHAVDVEDDQRRGVARGLDGALGELVEVAPVRQAGQGVDVDQVAELALRGEQMGDAPLVVHDQRELRHQQGDARPSRAARRGRRRRPASAGSR